MKINIKAILNIIFFISILMPCRAVENPNVGARSSAPPSSGQRQRFISGPNTYGRSGNDIVSGNVSGMKYFRGVVPYGSSYYTGAYASDSGSNAVSNFLRRSADPIVNDRNPGQPRSYYDPGRTVSSYRRPDQTSELSAPTLTGQGRRSSYIIPQPVAPSVYGRYQERPLSTNNMDLEQILARREQLRQQVEEDAALSDEMKTLKKNFFDQTPIPEENEKQDSEKPDETAEPALKSEQDVLAELQKQYEEDLKNQESVSDQGKAETASSKLKNYSGLQKGLLPKINPQITDSGEGKKILGEHKTFAALAEEKFATYMNTAENFIKEGQFYKAADTYALANIWKPEDTRGYLGQSFSLFGAGEYMSSAYYLSRAMELDSREALKKYDLAAFIGDRDVFENRVLDLSTWQQRSGSGELALLLAYISYQDGKAVRAKEAINIAKAAMPDSKAVKVLKNIIDPEDVLK
ncbi:MAG: hypothetical protein ACYTCV_09450 [Planctomycetota bacterium]|jgi:hypothetical protein